MGRKIFESYPVYASLQSTSSLTDGIEFEYDDLGRVVRTINTTNNAKTTLEYEDNLNRVVITDANNNQTINTYRSFGDPDQRDLVRVDSPEGVITNMLRHPYGDIINLTQRSSDGEVDETRQFIIDERHLLLQDFHSERGVTYYQNDVVGNLVSSSVGGLPENLIRYEYDSQNRLSLIDFPENNTVASSGAMMNSADVLYGYDSNNNLLALVKGSVRWDYVYDENDNLTNENLNVAELSFDLNNRYNALDAIEAVIYPSGLQVDYEPNELGWPTKVGRFASSISYFASGQVNTMTYANGITTTIELNSRLFPESIQAGSVLGLNYSYDPVGNVTSIIDQINSNGSLTNLTYDGLNRLLTADGPWGDSEIKYDAVGNIKTKRIGSQAKQYSYSGTRLSSTVGKSDRTYAYDQHGNMSEFYVQIQNNLPVYIWYHSYDHANNLIQTNGEDAWLYDGNNRRVSAHHAQFTNYVKNHTVYNQAGQLLYEANYEDCINSDYVRLGAMMIAKRNLFDDTDTDNDSITDCTERNLGLDPNNGADGAADPDGDGLSNAQEAALGTDLNRSDSDNDGMPDGYEAQGGLNPLNNDADQDNDNDGFTNYEEFQAGSDPNDGGSVPPPGQVIWTYITDGNISSAPAIASSGEIYFVSQTFHRLFALGEDGSKKWEVKASHNNSPVIAADGTIYSAYGEVLNAHNPDGSLRWTNSDIGDGGFTVRTSTVALAEEGTIYYVSEDHNKLFAISPEGITQWAFVYEAVSDVSSPVIGNDGTIYFTTYWFGDPSWLYAVNSDGSLQWRNQLNEGAGLAGGEMAIAFDGTIYLGGADDYLYAYNPDGSLRWSYFAGESIKSSITIDEENNVYFATFEEVFSLSSEGALNWTFGVNNVRPTDAIISKGGTIYVAIDDTVYALDNQGNTLWSADFQNDASTRALDMSMGPDGMLYIVNGNGNDVFAVNPQSSGLADSAWPVRGNNSRSTSNLEKPAVINITEPANNVRIALDQPPVSFVVVANHETEGDISGQTQWRSNIDGDLGSGATITPILGVGKHSITAFFTDTQGVTVTDWMTVYVSATTENAPEMTVYVPFEDSVFSPNYRLVFQASAFDLEDGDLSANIEWTTNVGDFNAVGDRVEVTFVTTGRQKVIVRVTDSDGITTEEVRNVVIRDGVNQDPRRGTSPEMQYVRGGEYFEYRIPDATFYDPDEDPLTLSIQNEMPVWLNFNPETNTLFGTAPNSNNAEFLLFIRAMDPGGLHVLSAVKINVADFNVPYISVEDPSASNRTIAYASYEESNLGTSIAPAGDVNGDGIDDFIVNNSGIYNSDSNQFRNEYYVVFGNASGLTANLNLLSLDGSNGFIIKGIEQRFGSSPAVLGIGDINNDNFDDIAITAYVPTTDFNRGEVYVVYGGNQFPAEIDHNYIDGVNGIRFHNEGTGDEDGIGAWLGAGDFNGDGNADLLIGDNNAENRRGRIYVVYGPLASTAAIDVDTIMNGTQGFSITGSTDYGYIGREAAVLDINNDGYSDVVTMMDPGSMGRSGELFVVFGHENVSTANINLGDLNGSNGYRILFTEGLGEDRDVIQTVASLEDINGDGINDLYIDIGYAFGGRDYSRIEGYVVFGRAGDSAASINIDNLDGSNGFTLHGNEMLGRYVSNAGDFNNDGIHDLILSEFNSSVGVHNILYGSASGFPAAVDVREFDGVKGIRIDASVLAEYGYNPLGVSSAGDVNADGFDDVLVANNVYGTQAYRSRVSIFYGRPSGAIFDTTPKLSNPIDDGIVDQGVLYSYQIPVDIFFDPLKTGLTLTADLEDGSAVPAWLLLDPQTQILSGTPAAADVGVINIRITATNNNAESVADVFQLTIRPADADADNDGVPDIADLCADTPSNEIVDANGCAPSQLDNDGDGINNALDQCPATPPFEPVDAQGCGETQLDDDEDGVSNAVDECPGTPPLEPANAQGCSATQLDNDGDGVNDANDLCPDTPAGDEVDENGCTLNPISEVELSASLLSPQVVGTVVTLTAEAIDSHGDVEYQFRLRGPSTSDAWIVLQDFSPNTMYVWDSAGYIGKNRLQVKARELSSGEVVKTAITFWINDTNAATSVTLTPSLENPITEGQVVTLTAQGEGGSGNYEFQFRLKGPSEDDQWQVLQDFSADNNIDWDSTQQFGRNRIQVRARNAGSNDLFVKAAQTVWVNTLTAATDVVLDVNLTSPQTVGAVVTLTAQANGGSGNYLYLFRYRGPATDDEWVTLQDFAPNNSIIWDSTGLLGRNRLQVQARNVDTADQVVKAAQTMWVNSDNPATGANLFVGLSSPQAPGIDVRLGASGEGGSNDYEFQFRVRGSNTDNKWQVLQDFSTQTNIDWSTNGYEGQNRVQVRVRNFGTLDTPVSSSQPFTVE